MYSIYLSINQKRRHLYEMLTFLWKDRQTDRQTDIVVYMEVTLPKMCCIFDPE